jgi:hypothetical protein
MKPVGLIRTGVLFSLIATVVPTYAQQDQRQPDAKPPKQEQQAKPEKQKSKDKQQQQRVQQPQQGQRQQQQRVQQQRQQDQNRQQQQRAQQQRQQQSNRPSQQGQRVQRGEQRGVWQQHRARSWEAEHRTWQQRGGYDGYRIPEYRYRRYFGPRHPFRIYRYPVMLFGGYPRFQYGGFWFSLMDPWPEYWSDDWWENDDVYIDYYEDGYYLYNRRYPGVRIAITVYVR